ncbi:MAG: hypothetical protein Q9162_004873 [Coniocarpon cinnabarinum]
MSGAPARGGSGGYSGSGYGSRMPPRNYEDRAVAKEQMMQSVRDSSQQDRRVYIGNLSYDVKWHHLKDFMRQAGDVIFSDVLLLPNGMSKGCGIVEYATRDQAQNAINTLSNQNLMGRLVYVRELPYTVGWQDLKDFFRQAAMTGNIVRADVNIGPDGRPKGTGIVAFDNSNDAMNAIQNFNGYEWQGRQLEVREDRFAGSGYGGRGGFGGYGNMRGGVPPAPNPFTDNATGNGDRSETIYVRNLPWSTSNEDLVELFQTIGKVDQAEIQYEPNGRSRGTGVVRFDNTDNADTAIQKFSGYQYGGRPLGLSYVKYLGAGESAMGEGMGMTQDQMM